MKQNSKKICCLYINLKKIKINNYGFLITALIKVALRLRLFKNTFYQKYVKPKQLGIFFVPTSVFGSNILRDVYTLVVKVKIAKTKNEHYMYKQKT